MKKAVVVLMAVLMLTATCWAAEKGAAKSKDVTMTGKISCTFCNLPAAGDCTKDCCQMCVKSGDPVLFTNAKGGLYIFTRQFARTYIAQGINCNSVAPGWSLDTDFVKGGQAAKEKMKPMFMAETPVGHGTAPDDVASMVAFLASDI